MPLTGRYLYCRVSRARTRPDTGSDRGPPPRSRSGVRVTLVAIERIFEYDR